MTEAMPEETTEGAPSADARKWAMICHLAALVGVLGNGIGFLLGALIAWLIKKDDDPFIDEQGKEAVNFQLTMLLAAIVSAVLILINVDAVLPLIIALMIIALMMIILPIIAGIKANDGEHYRYPLTIRFIK